MRLNKLLNYKSNNKIIYSLKNLPMYHDCINEIGYYQKTGPCDYLFVPIQVLKMESTELFERNQIFRIQPIKLSFIFIR